jgi:hypothetical protein
VTLTAPAELTAGPFELRYAVRAPRYAIGQRYLVLQPALLESARPPAGLADPTRRQPLFVSLTNGPEQVENHLRFRLPPELTVGEMPADESRTAPFGSFRVTYRVTGDILDYVRQVTLSRAVVSADELVAARAWFGALVEADERRFVVLQRR